MFNISDYLKKFSKIEGDSLLRKDVIAGALKECCGVEGISFEVKKGIVYIQASPVAKSLVYTRKNLILETIKARLPQEKIIDIR